MKNIHVDVTAKKFKHSMKANKTHALYLFNSCDLFLFCGEKPKGLGNHISSCPTLSWNQSNSKLLKSLVLLLIFRLFFLIYVRVFCKELIFLYTDGYSNAIYCRKVFKIYIQYENLKSKTSKIHFLHSTKV